MGSAWYGRRTVCKRMVEGQLCKDGGLVALGLITGKLAEGDISVDREDGGTFRMANITISQVSSRSPRSAASVIYFADRAPSLAGEAGDKAGKGLSQIIIRSSVHTDSGLHALYGVDEIGADRENGGVEWHLEMTESSKKHGSASRTCAAA